MKLIRNIVFGCCLFIVSIGYGQFANSDVFLLDSVDYTSLGKSDQLLLDSSLAGYHQAEHDTSRLIQLGNLADGLNDGKLWPRYNELLYQETLKLQQNKYDGKTWARIISFRSNAINNFGYLEYGKGRTKEALDYWKKASRLQKSVNYDKGYANTLNNIGAAYDARGEFDSALYYYQICYDMELKLQDTLTAAQVINNMGVAYKAKSDYTKAQRHHLRALKLLENTNAIEKIAMTHGYLGELFKAQRNFVRAKEHYDKSLDLRESISNTEGISHSNNFLGSLYLIMDSLDRATQYFNEALVGYRSLGYIRGESSVMSNLGAIFRQRGRLKEALEITREAMNMRMKMNSPLSHSYDASQMSEIFVDLNLADSALYYAQKAMKIARERNHLRTRSEAGHALYRSYKLLGMEPEALIAFEAYVMDKDSLAKEDDKIALIEGQYQYDMKKKAYSDSIKNANRQLEHEQAIAIRDLETSEQRTQNYILWGGLTILFGLMFIVWRAFVSKKKSNQEISQKHSELEVQKLIVEGKNAQIIDSINYAKRIQTALLSAERNISNQVPDHFIFYEPKDIVSGDFYWMQENNGYLYMCVADCTGHGVPGAFMSMLGIAFLQEIMSRETAPPPHEILNKLREKVITELAQTGDLDAPKDGMDASIIRLNLKTKMVEWSGANNGLVVISPKESLGLKDDEVRVTRIDNNDDTLVELLPQRMPVGFMKNSSPFISKTLQLYKGDQIYLYTDGYSDQFGGARKKKYKLSVFKKFVLSISNLDLVEQNEALIKEHNRWKGDLEQLDDICIVGLKL